MDDRRLISLLIAGLAMLMMSQIAVAQDGNPQPAQNVTIGNSGRYNGISTGFALDAQAGNVTHLAVTHVQPTQFWAGYYGNITGEITLDDADNNTLFSWALASPTGEIFAVNQSNTPSWANITCVNLTNATAAGGVDTHGASKINRTTIQSAYNLTDQDFDNMTATFNQTFDGTVIIGPRTIVADDQCPQINTYVNNEFQETQFNEILLFDNDSALIFATVLEDSIDGFLDGTGETLDFQMMVLEDGSPGGPDETLTSYYFYVELE